MPMSYLEFAKKAEERFVDEPGTEWLRSRQRSVGQAATAGSMEQTEPSEAGQLEACAGADQQMPPRIPRAVMRAAIEMYPDAA